VIVLLGSFFIGFGINKTIIKPNSYISRGVNSQSENPAYAQVLFEEGLQSMQKGNDAEAIIILEQAVKYNPKLVAAYEALGISYHMIHEYQRSISAWHRVIELGNNGFNVHYRLGMVYIDLKQWAYAEESLRLAISHIKESKWTKEYTAAHYNLGKSIINTGMVQDEIFELMNNDDAEAHFRLAILNLWLGNEKDLNHYYDLLKNKKSVLAKELKILIDGHKKYS